MTFRNSIRNSIGLLALIILGVSNGCDTNRKAEIVNLQIDSLKTELDSLKAVIEDVRWKQSWYEISESLDEVAYLTPGSSGYSILKTDIGVVTVSLENVLAYANGSRVTLHFGNTTSATIYGVKAKFEWGRVDMNSRPDNGTTRSKEISITQSLSGGVWNSVSIVLEGVPASELGFVRIKDFQHGGIRLRQW